jgi:hypothetical protein
MFQRLISREELRKPRQYCCKQDDISTGRFPHGMTSVRDLRREIALRKECRSSSGVLSQRIRCLDGCCDAIMGESQSRQSRN